MNRRKYNISLILRCHEKTVKSAQNSCKRDVEIQKQKKNTIVCSQRNPENWKAMILNDEVSANSIMKRATKHYTIKINTK